MRFFLSSRNAAALSCAASATLLALHLLRGLLLAALVGWLESGSATGSALLLALAFAFAFGVAFVGWLESGSAAGSALLALTFGVAFGVAFSRFARVFFVPSTAEGAAAALGGRPRFGFSIPGPADAAFFLLGFFDASG